MLENPPETVWLQYHGEDGPDDGPVDMSDITWCNEQIFDSDIEYIRADVARRADRKAREECAEIASAHASCEGIAESIEYQIRATIKEE